MPTVEGAKKRCCAWPNARKGEAAACAVCSEATAEFAEISVEFGEDFGRRRGILPTAVDEMRSRS